MVIKGRGPLKPAAPITTHTEHADPTQPWSIPPRIREYRALKKLPRAGEALEMLRRIGAVVRPLMIKHQWELPSLTEFLPKQENLLGINVNGGQKISLRLRWNHSQDAFLDEESVIHTMLHELTHNVRGPHDEKFFKFLGELTEEYYELKRKGALDRQAFTGKAFRLGGSSISPQEARRVAAQSAERRRRLAALTQGGGRLGGPEPTTSKSSAQLAAEAAEQRRKYQTGSCPETQAAIEEIEVEAEEDEIDKGVEVITIQDDDEEPEIWVIDSDDDTSKQEADDRGKSARESPEVITLGDSSESSDDEPIVVGQSGVPPKRRRIGESEWFCSACTLKNLPRALRCSACDTERPRISMLDRSRRKQLISKGKEDRQPNATNIVAAPSGWKCSTCGFDMLGDLSVFWMCRGCGAIRKS